MMQNNARVISLAVRSSRLGVLGLQSRPSASTPQHQDLEGSMAACGMNGSHPDDMQVMTGYNAEASST